MAARSADTSARWSPSPESGSRNPAASPTSRYPSPLLSARPMRERHGNLERVGGRRLVPVGEAPGQSLQDGPDEGPCRGVPSTHLPEHPLLNDHADVDPTMRHGRDPAVPAVADDHARDERYARQARPGVGEVAGQAGPTQGPDGSIDARGTGDHRSRPVGADDEARAVLAGESLHGGSRHSQGAVREVDRAHDDAFHDRRAGGSRPEQRPLQADRLLSPQAPGVGWVSRHRAPSRVTISIAAMDVISRSTWSAGIPRSRSWCRVRGDE